MSKVKTNLLKCVITSALMMGNIEVSTVSEKDLEQLSNNQSPASLVLYSGWALTLSKAYACDNNSCEGTTSYPPPPGEDDYGFYDPWPGYDGIPDGGDSGDGGLGGSTSGDTNEYPNLPPAPGDSRQSCKQNANDQYTHCQNMVNIGATVSVASCGAIGLVWTPLASSICFSITGAVLVVSLDQCNDVRNNSTQACDDYFDAFGSHSGGSRGGAGIIP